MLKYKGDENVKLGYEVTFGRLLHLVFTFWILTCTFTLFPIMHTKLEYSRSGVSWEDNFAEYCFQFPMDLQNGAIRQHKYTSYSFTNLQLAERQRDTVSLFLRGRGPLLPRKPGAGMAPT